MSKKEEKKKQVPTPPKKEPEPSVAVEAVEEQKQEKPEKAGKAPKKKKKEKGIHSMYEVESDKVTRLRPLCERCGPGYFMADHRDRYTCGHCGFTRYKRTEK